ncbi:MAG: DUF484 family protein [Alphaproteobacteria bacterium]|nr:DUF484 family protein [Alphaproteobacteria bacterium]
MSEQAQERSPAEAAAEAVKAYVRMNRDKLRADGELLAQLLPERFETASVRDLQHFVIERLSAENARLKAERDALRSTQTELSALNDAIRSNVLQLLDARSFARVIAIAIGAGSAFGADKATFCVECEESVARYATDGVRLIPKGTIAALMNRGAVLARGGRVLLGSSAHFGSLAAFQLQIGPDAPAALYVLAARAQRRFEGEGIEAGLQYFSSALERAIRAWLDLPKS